MMNKEIKKLCRAWPLAYILTMILEMPRMEISFWYLKFRRNRTLVWFLMSFFEFYFFPLPFFCSFDHHGVHGLLWLIQVSLCVKCWLKFDSLASFCKGWRALVIFFHFRYIIFFLITNAKSGAKNRALWCDIHFMIPQFSLHSMSAGKRSDLFSFAFFGNGFFGKKENKVQLCIVCFYVYIERWIL